MKLAFYEDYILVLKKKKEEARRMKDEYVYKFKELIPYTHITALYRDTSTSSSTYFCIICEVTRISVKRKFNFNSSCISALHIATVY